MLVMSYEKCP